MKLKQLVSLTALLFATFACFGPAGGGGGGRQPSVLPPDTAWPATVEGVLELAVEEGTPYEDGLSEINFCSIELEGGGYYLVEVGVAPIRAAGMTRDDLISDPRVRATLSGPSDSLFSSETPYYVVTALERLAE